MTTSNQTAPGWYPDPSDPSRLRWHNGAQWTEATHPNPQPPAAQQPYGGLPYGSDQQIPQDGCQQCGATPAMAAVLHEHHGMLLVMRRLTYRGQWCRDCGIARFREVQRKTMMYGWWGYFSSVINLFTVIRNTGTRKKFAALGAPQGRLRAGLSAGESVFKSPGFAVSICLPLVLVLIFLAH